MSTKVTVLYRHRNGTHHKETPRDKLIRLFPLGSAQNLANAAGVRAGPGPLISLGGQETGCINRLGKEVNLLRTMGARFLTGREWSLKYTLRGCTGMGDTGVNSRFFNRWRCFPSSVSWEDPDYSRIARLIPSTRIWVSTRSPSLKGEMAEFRFRARKAQEEAKCKEVFKEWWGPIRSHLESAPTGKSGTTAASKWKKWLNQKITIWQPSSW